MNFEWFSYGKEKSNVLKAEGSFLSDNFYYGSNLNDDENVIELRIERFSMGKIAVGICNENNVHIHRWKRRYRDANDEKLSVGWCLESNGKKIGPDRISKDYANNDCSFENGGVVRIRCNMILGTLSFEVNGVDHGVAFVDVKGSRIHPVVFCESGRYEITAIIIEHELNSDDEERLAYVTDEFSDFEIELSNKTLSLWKSLFSSSPVLEMSSSRYTGLQNRYLCINEDVILKIILFPETKLELRNCDLVDYFLFFKYLSMENEMIVVLKKIRKINFIPTFELLRSFCLDYENKDIKRLFSTYIVDEERVEYQVTFDHSISEILFQQLLTEYKRKIDEEEWRNVNVNIFEHNQPFFEYLSSLVTNEQEKEKKRLAVFETHKDFQRTRANTKDSDLLRCQFRQLTLLWKNQTSQTNLILRTRGGGKFQVHREIVCSKLNFFFRMFRFGGVEYESMKNTGEVILEDIGTVEVQYLLEFVYTGNVVLLNEGNEKLGNLINLYLHCEKYVEGKYLLDRILETISLWVKKLPKRVLKRVLIESSHLLEENEMVRMKIFSVFRSRFSLSMIKSLSRESKEKKEEGDLWIL